MRLTVVPAAAFLLVKGDFCALSCSAVSVYMAAAYAFSYMAVEQHVVWHGAT